MPKTFVFPLWAAMCRRVDKERQMMWADLPLGFSEYCLRAQYNNYAMDYDNKTNHEQNYLLFASIKVLNGLINSFTTRSLQLDKAVYIGNCLVVCVGVCI